MNVRAALPADHATVLSLIRAEPALPQWKAADLAQNSPPANSTAVQRVLLVAEDLQGIFGFAQVGMVACEAELEAMAVAPHKQRQGTGRLLLNACLQWAEQAGATLFRLEVRSSNATAIRLYNSAGLQAVGTRRAYYRNPVEDALLMQCNR